MKFDKIIEAVGFKPCTFPMCSNITVTVYNGKNREEIEKLSYKEELFADNIKSANEFFNFLCFLEAKPVSSMDVIIDEALVIILYATGQAFYFKRSKPLDILAYMSDYSLMG